MGQSGYNTNLAAEFYVLSCLHRLGLDATLTLGNKKGIDIVITYGAGRAVTVDVKGLAGKTGWPVDNVNFAAMPQNHVLVFVCYAGKVADPQSAPEIYVVPGPEATGVLYTAPGGRKLITRSRLRLSGKFENAWRNLSYAAEVTRTAIRKSKR